MQRQRTVDHLRGLPEVVEAASVDAQDLIGRRDVIIHGEVVGNAELQGAVFLGPHSHWRGNLTAAVIIVKGCIEGDVMAHQKLEIRSTARVQGTLTAPLIAVARGAHIDRDFSANSCVVYFEERRA